MINGVVGNNKPLAPIIIGWRYGVQEVLALVDTGFTGELKVSPQQVANLGLVVTHTEPVSLGDNREVDMQCSLAVVNLEGVANVVNVLIAPGDIIIGVGLLKRFGYILNANFRIDSLSLRRA